MYALYHDDDALQREERLRSRFVMPVSAATPDARQTPEGGRPLWARYHEDIDKGVRPYQVMAPTVGRTPFTSLSPDPISGADAIRTFLPQKQVMQERFRPSFQVNRHPHDGERAQQVQRSFIKEAFSVPISGEFNHLHPDSTRANPNGQIVVPHSGTHHTSTKRAVWRTPNTRRTTLGRFGTAKLPETYTTIGYTKPPRNADVREASLQDAVPTSTWGSGEYYAPKEVRSKPNSKERAINRVGTPGGYAGVSRERVEPSEANSEATIRRRRHKAGVLEGPLDAHEQGAGVLTVVDPRLRPCVDRMAVNDTHVLTLGGGARKKTSEEQQDRVVVGTGCDGSAVDADEVIQVRYPYERPSLAMATIEGKNRWSDPAPSRPHVGRVATFITEYDPIRTQTRVFQSARSTRGNTPSPGPGERARGNAVRNTKNTLRLPHRVDQQADPNHRLNNPAPEPGVRARGNAVHQTQHTLRLPHRLEQQTTPNRSNENDVRNRQSMGYSSHYLSGQDLPGTNRETTDVLTNHGWYNVHQRGCLKPTGASTLTDHVPLATNRSDYTDADSAANVPVPGRAVGDNAGTFSRITSQRLHSSEFIDAPSRQNQPERQRPGLGPTLEPYAMYDMRPNVGGRAGILRGRMPNGVSDMGSTGDALSNGPRIHYPSEPARQRWNSGEQQLACRPQFFGEVGVPQRTDGFEDTGRRDASTYYQRDDTDGSILSPLASNPYQLWAAYA